MRRDAAEDPFLRQGIMLAVDGTEPDLIMDILETEMQFIEMRHEQARRAIRVAGRCFLAMGSAVALVSLVLLTGRNTEMLRVVQLTALPFLYGVVGWALATPIAHKLRVYSEAEVLAKRLVIEAIMAIQSGDNPRIVEHKLSVFLPPARRPSGDRHPVKSSLAPIPDTSFVEEVDRLAADLGPADFIFADITKLTDHEIQRLLREVDQKALVISLVGATAEIREKLTRNMSERVSTFILSETGNVADIGAERVAGIQAAICNQIVRMSKHGKITLP
ncbi:MAG: FliG C-terminal domain-containing protein [Candidatus Latescibacterota bacterium]